MTRAAPAPNVPSDIAFTEAVKAIQRERGSRASYARMEKGGGWSTEIDLDLAAFISEQTSIFFATANAAGQPYIQHRGGPAGFLRVLGPRALGFADFTGNRQYISLGNLSENPKVHLFLIDYETRQRVKIWGRARAVAEDPALLASLAPAGYRAKPEQAILIDVEAWDANCPQHIPQRFDAADVQRALERRDERIAELESELARLMARPASRKPSRS